MIHLKCQAQRRNSTQGSHEFLDTGIGLLCCISTFPMLPTRHLRLGYSLASLLCQLTARPDLRLEARFLLYVPRPTLPSPVLPRTQNDFLTHWV